MRISLKKGNSHAIKIGVREEIVKEGKVWKIRKNPVQLNVRVVYPAKKICDLVPVYQISPCFHVGLTNIAVIYTISMLPHINGQ